MRYIPSLLIFIIFILLVHAAQGQESCRQGFPGVTVWEESLYGGKCDRFTEGVHDLSEFHSVGSVSVTPPLFWSAGFGPNCDVAPTHSVGDYDSNLTAGSYRCLTVRRLSDWVPWPPGSPRVFLPAVSR